MENYQVLRKKEEETNRGNVSISIQRSQARQCPFDTSELRFGNMHLSVGSTYTEHPVNHVSAKNMTFFCLWEVVSLLRVCNAGLRACTEY